MRYIKGYNIEPRPQLLIRCGDRLHLPPLNPTHTHSSASRSLQRRGRQRHRLPGLKPNIGRRPCLRSKAMRTIYAKSSACARTVVRKWLNLKGQDLELHEKDNSRGSTKSQQRRNSFSNKDEFLIIPRDISVAEWLVNTSEALKPASCPPQTIRMFVGTWNVGGRAPYSDLNLREWLDGPSATTADVYVLGFQEVVPLNVGNVLGAEDRAPAVKWLSLIRRALNRTRYEYPDASSVEDVSEPAAAALTPAAWKPEDPRSGGNRESYRLVASKQMVGLFLCVWVRASLLRHVTCVHVSCVGRGLMGYMGNKGSIAISMRLRGTKLCFVCTHLASGEREGDEARRNADVVKILKKTRFTHSWDSDSPVTILDHE
ncbi:hypothetical protein HPP92_019332 [Vanilla planifolia]|uniref:Inositol polyphosphate-related phosphatase domain-containing protein n=1 Tax=Vanilla planifolia TaxID=51239 RepID=A0A835QA37_VANPL|nr:hypothetical protein HPP92_019332 [Vanilla planifolia]